MRRALILVFTALLVIGILAPMARTDDRAGGLALVKVSGRHQASLIANNFDETHRLIPGAVEVYLWPGDADRLDAMGYEFEITIADLWAHDRRLENQENLQVVPMPGPDMTDYRRLADYNAEMADLADKNPKLVKLLELPNPSLEGRTIYGLEIAANVKEKVNDGRPTFYVDGIHHAREWPAAEYPMIFAHYLVEGYGKNPNVTSLLNTERVIVVPVVNVDGFNFSRESVLGAQANIDAAHGTACGVAHCAAYWRKNRRSYTGVTVPVVQTNPDAYGVDPNRNYSYHWGGGGSNSGVAVGPTHVPQPIADQTNRGAAPFSEPESRNVEQTVLRRNVTSLITNHTSGNLVLRPWGDTYKHAPDEKYLFTLGAAMSKAMGGYQNIKGIQLYITTGTTSEWAYGVLGIPSYTFEHGQSFHPPYTDCEAAAKGRAATCVAQQFPGVMKAYVLAAQAGLDRAMHGVIEGEIVDSKGNPVAAKLTLSKKVPTPLAPENPLGGKSFKEVVKMSLQVDRAFVWHVPASTRPVMVEKGKTETYTLTITAPGFEKQTLTLLVKKGQVLDLGTIRL
ncbi:MAG: M14 family zinc carboxypeptidase [Actinomycetota bacterium]